MEGDNEMEGFRVMEVHSVATAQTTRRISKLSHSCPLVVGEVWISELSRSAEVEVNRPRSCASSNASANSSDE